METSSERLVSVPVAEAEPPAPTRRASFLPWLGRFKLQTKLIVPYVLLTVFVALIGTFVVTRLVTASVQERLANRLYEASRVAGDGVVRRERSHLETLRLMAFTQGVPEALAGEQAETLQNLLLPLALNNNVEVVSAVNKKGQEVITLARDPASGQYLISHDGADFSNFEPVGKILQSQSDTVGDKFIGLREAQFGPYLFTTAPVRDSKGELVGVLMIGTQLQVLLEDLRSQASADGVIVLDPTGKLVATTLAQPDEGYATLELETSVVSDLLNSSQESPPLTRDLMVNQRSYRAFFAPLIIRQQTMGALGVVIASDYVVATEATSRNQLSLIFALGTAFVVLIGYLLARSIANPILRLRTISQAVAAGDLTQQTGLKQGDEIGELASAFDTMTLRLRQRTAELVQSEKLAAVGQLTAGIVHDVKNPLAVIKGLSEELREELGSDPAVLEQLNAIRDNATRANTIVSDLMKFARQSTPEMTRRDLRETVEASLRLTEYLARRAKVKYLPDLPAHSVLVTYDAQQLEQVLINLIQNAIQAMPNGGTLRVNLSQTETTVAIAVQDTGSGIAAENLPRVFDPFFTTKPEGEGTGLGLSVSYGIVARHGGRINVESQVGAGTTFTILLPVEQPEFTQG